MIISFEHNGKKYVNFDISNEETRQQLTEQGINIRQVAKEERKQELSQATDSYIQRKLSEIDEDLTDLVSEKSWLEGVFDAHGISPEQVRKETVLVILGKKPIDEAISELSIPDDLIPDFKRAVEIARIIAWKEAVWKAEAKLEEKVDSMTLEELLQLDVKRLCEDTYSKIPLEV
jgi:ribosomal protein L12E/L44/L45/RPP1/RPP2